jgi:ribosome recycling factor
MASNVLLDIRDRMQNSVEALKRELTTLRTGRASPALVEHIKVEYAGVPTPLNQIAGIFAPEARLIIIQPWERGSIPGIEKAILKSDLGLNPSSDGNVIRLNIPPLTEERRQDLIRVLRRRVEEARVEIRNLRREAVAELRSLEKNKDLSQDEHKRALDQLQKLTDSLIADSERVGQDKEADLMEV